MVAWGGYVKFVDQNLKHRILAWAYQIALVVVPNFDVVFYGFGFFHRVFGLCFGFFVDQ